MKTKFFILILLSGFLSPKLEAMKGRLKYLKHLKTDVLREISKSLEEYNNQIKEISKKLPRFAERIKLSSYGESGFVGDSSILMQYIEERLLNLEKKSYEVDGEVFSLENGFLGLIAQNVATALMRHDSKVELETICNDDTILPINLAIEKKSS